MSLSPEELEKFRRYIELLAAIEAENENAL